MVAVVEHGGPYGPPYEGGRPHAEAAARAHRDAAGGRLDQRESFDGIANPRSATRPHTLLALLLMEPELSLVERTVYTAVVVYFLYSYFNVSTLLRSFLLIMAATLTYANTSPSNIGPLGRPRGRHRCHAYHGHCSR